MYWHQKASLLGTTQARTDQLQTLIQNRLAGIATREQQVFQTTAQGKSAPTLIVVVDYNDQATADGVWSDVQNARTQGWIATPSFAAYAAMNDDGTTVLPLIGRIDW
jgi:hypothetical protein